MFGAAQPVSRDIGDPSIVISTLYSELRTMARYHLSRERNAHTVQPTALVHEVYLRLANQSTAQQKEQFLSLASRVMRQVLIDYARRRRSAKRGDSPCRITLAEDIAIVTPNMELLALDEALGQLQHLDARQARIVEMRVFGGLTVDEIATVLEISARTVKREWMMARAWLQLRLRQSQT
jgi:RNA polymerase sigma factor (TIGR02999 family)